MKNKQEELQEKADFIRDSLREDGVSMKPKGKKMKDIYIKDNVCSGCGDRMDLGWTRKKEIDFQQAKKLHNFIGMESSYSHFEIHQCSCSKWLKYDYWSRFGLEKVFKKL